MEIGDSIPKTDVDSKKIQELRKKIIDNLLDLGFSISGERELFLPEDKTFIRRAHKNAVDYAIRKKQRLIERHDERFLNDYIANGNEIEVKSIWPKLITVDNQNSDLFNWIKLHWSIPISSGYGRRLRYIVTDENTGSVIGIIGLADPVYGLRDRDKVIGWSPQVRKRKLKHVMDAFVLGAVPPYSMILGGKLVASMLASPIIRKDFKRKYKGKRSIISGELFNGKLAAITTASALGRSSIYDRINIKHGPRFIHSGWSQGSGEFHLLSDFYPELSKLVRDDVLKMKNPLWGSGIRNRRVVLLKALDTLGLPSSLLYHNVKRELFIVPQGSDAFKYLQGKSNGVGYYQISHEEIARKMLKRWVFKRAETDESYLKFRREEYSLAKTQK